METQALSVERTAHETTKRSVLEARETTDNARQEKDRFERDLRAASENLAALNASTDLIVGTTKAGKGIRNYKHH